MNIEIKRAFEQKINHVGIMVKTGIIFFKSPNIKKHISKLQT